MIVDTDAGFTIARETFRQSTGTYLRPRFRTLTGYTLTDPDGAYLMIGEHGCVAPTLADAKAERDHRKADATATLAISDDATTRQGNEVTPS